jgi:hypothetical protein
MSLQGLGKKIVAGRIIMPVMWPEITVGILRCPASSNLKTNTAISYTTLYTIFTLTPPEL